jgi:transcriptional regulator with XRE-family HTH domain
MSSQNNATMSEFGDTIRKLREQQELLLRELASEIKIDQALLSKIERGERIATRKQAISIAEFFNVSREEFLSQWLGEKIANDLKDEELASKALKVAENVINYQRRSEKIIKHV